MLMRNTFTDLEIETKSKGISGPVTTKCKGPTDRVNTWVVAVKDKSNKSY